MTSPTPEALWSAGSLRVLRPAAVVCRKVTRAVGGRTLLDRFSLLVPVGMRLLVVARPEESASLLVRILAGLSRASSGRIEVAGLAAGSEGQGRRVGYVGPEAGVYAWMSPRETLALSARLHELSAVEALRRSKAAIAHYGLANAADRPMGRGGPELAQRVALAATMLGDPEVVLLDEPLRAVEAETRTRLLQIPGRRRSVILASRYPATEAGLCSHVAFIRHGRLALLAPVMELAARGLPLSFPGIEALAAQAADDLRPGSAGA